jgi:GNAT superfamily N-acetyltransferase
MDGDRSPMTKQLENLVVCNTRPEHFSEIIEISRKVYFEGPPWSEEQLKSHLRVFPEGQFVVVDEAGGRVVGMAACLIILWDDYSITSSWRDFTDHGMFTNHDPYRGRTLYGAEIMILPNLQRRGAGTRLYAARRELAERLGLLRIRATSRLRGYHRYAGRMSPEDYVAEVVQGRIKDPTLSFQLKNGFEVLAVVSGYLRKDPESLGFGAVIEWINENPCRPGAEFDRPLPFKSQPPPASA